MKKVEQLAAKKGYTISFSDKSGNWRGGHHRGGYITIIGNGFRKECTTIAEALAFLR